MVFLNNLVYGVMVIKDYESKACHSAIACQSRNFLVAQMVKNLPAMQETWVLSLGQEDPLEKEMATHFRIIAGKSHGWRSLVGYSPWGCKESDMTE